jgi:hypothetical protein
MSNSSFLSTQFNSGRSTDGPDPSVQATTVYTQDLWSGACLHASQQSPAIYTLPLDHSLSLGSDLDNVLSLNQIGCSPQGTSMFPTAAWSMERSGLLPLYSASSVVDGPCHAPSASSSNCLHAHMSNAQNSGPPEHPFPLLSSGGIADGMVALALPAGYSDTGFNDRIASDESPFHVNLSSRHVPTVTGSGNSQGFSLASPNASLQDPAGSGVLLDSTAAGRLYGPCLEMGPQWYPEAGYPTYPVGHERDSCTEAPFTGAVATGDHQSDQLVTTEYYPSQGGDGDDGCTLGGPGLGRGVPSSSENRSNTATTNLFSAKKEGDTVRYRCHSCDRAFLSPKSFKVSPSTWCSWRQTNHGSFTSRTLVYTRVRQNSCAPRALRLDPCASVLVPVPQVG